MRKVKISVDPFLNLFNHIFSTDIHNKISGSERFTRWLEGSEGERRVCGVFNELSRTSRFMLKSREISLKTPQTLRSLCSLKPSKQYALLPLLLFALSPLAPTEVVGTLKPSIQYASLPLPLDPPHPISTEVVGTLKQYTICFAPFAPPTPCPYRGGGDLRRPFAAQ